MRVHHVCQKPTLVFTVLLALMISVTNAMQDYVLDNHPSRVSPAG